MSAFNPLAFLLAQERNFPKVKQTQWCERQSKITSLIRQNSLRNPWAHLLQEGFGVSERACQTGKGRGKKLVTEDSKPVGSGRFRVPSQDSSWVLGTSWSSSFHGMRSELHFRLK